MEVLQEGCESLGEFLFLLSETETEQAVKAGIDGKLGHKPPISSGWIRHRQIDKVRERERILAYNDRSFLEVPIGGTNPE